MRIVIARPPLRAMVFASILAASLTACSSSKLVNMWKDPEHPQQPAMSTLVISVNRDATRRRMWEDAFVADLAEAGVKAVASYRDFPTALPDTQQVVNQVKRNGYESVLIVLGLGSETQQNYVPGYVTTMPVTYYSNWTGYYGAYYQNVYTPGYTTTDSIVRQRIDVWSVDEGGVLVWTGTTETMNPSSGDQIRREVTGLVVPELKKRGVIATK